MKPIHLPLAMILFAAAALAAAPPEELKDASGKTIIQYVVEAPDNAAPAGTTDPARQLALILCFPEHDRPVGDEIYPVREALKRLGLRDGFVLLAGGPQERKFGPADHEPIGKLIEWAKKTYPINPRRVYVYGKGEGGKISGELSTLHPDVIAASVSYSWTWWKMADETTKAIDQEKEAPGIYMVLGLRDLSHHLTNVRDGYSRVHAKGYRAIYREIADLGARTYHPASNDDAIAWVSRNRNKNVPLSAGERKLLAAAPKAGPRGYFEDLALVGGAPAGEVLQKLLASPDAATRTAAAATFSQGIFGEAAAGALGTRLNDPDRRVRRAAARALAMQANWRSRSAQDALTGFLADPAKATEPADRVSVADAVVEAARFQIKGVQQDAGLFQTLVALLEDPDEELRTIAGNALMPIRDPEFRGDLGRPERKAPEGGWAAWLAEVATRAQGYQKNYAECERKPSGKAPQLLCEGATLAASDPARAFALTKQAAELGYHPAEAMLGIMYVVGKGVPQNNPEGAKWLALAADAGDRLAATNAWMLYNGSPGLRKDAALAERYLQISRGAAANAPALSGRR
ncbi:MAG: hypothetical protein R2762_25485 [Bryobacteraceae bacterium]